MSTRGPYSHPPKLALIPPIDLLEYTDMTKVQLMLPHLVTNPLYAYTYKQHCKDPEQFVILDNGAAEQMTAGIHDLITLAVRFGVDEVVAPDIFYDRTGTQFAFREFLGGWQKRVNDHRGQVGLMYVIQGKDYSDFLRSAQWAAENDEISTIGIPRHAIETCGLLEARSNLAAYVDRLSGKPVHLLGASPLHPTELKKGEHHWTKNVRSTDTSMPFNYAFALKKMRKNIEVSRPNNYFNLPYTAFDEETLKYNIESLRSWTR
jgi:hypothetical protein